MIGSIVSKFYKENASTSLISKDLLVNLIEFEALLKKGKVKDFNAVIVYSDKGLSAKEAVKSSTVQYIGNLKQGNCKSEPPSLVHYLWIGDTKSDKKSILKQASIEKNNIIKLKYYHTSKKQKVDEILVLQIEDYNVAEKMILKADELKFTTINSMLDLSVDSNIVIDGNEVANQLGMHFIGKFELY
jgi:hypothetical protein